MGHRAEGDTMTHNKPNQGTLCISPVNPAFTSHISIVLNEHPRQFLVDTGAAVTLISTSTFTRCHLSLPKMEQWTQQRLISVTGSPLNVKGQATIQLQIKGHQFCVPMVVVDGLTEEAILGVDFLKKHHCIIDFENQCLRFSEIGLTVPLCDKETSKDGKSIPTLNAILKDTIIVPGQTELEVLAVVPNSCGCTGTWLLENQLSPKAVLVARAIVVPKSEIVIRLINPTSTSAMIYKNTKLAILSQLPDNDLSISTVGPDKQNFSNEKKSTLWKSAQMASNLTESQRNQLYNLLLSYEDIFPGGPSDLGRTAIIKHRINTEMAQPVRQPLRRIPAHLQGETTKMINEMLRNDVIQKSTSPWSSPVVLVKKKDGSARFCIDYRQVNNLTKKDAYPLPRMDETLDALSGSKWFSTLDLLSGYWQVEVAEEDREKTAFATRDGLYEFKVLPFGLCNGPATFQRLMDMVLSGLHWTRCLVYLDDIIIFSQDFPSHLDNLKFVFQRLREAGLKVKPTKCEFFKNRVPFLGHIVSQDGVSTDPTKTEKIANWSTPTSRHRLQQFLGLASYYRHFIKNFATLCRPLYQMTEKSSSFKWTKECQEAFEELKRMLVSPPILTFPDFSKDFILDTDASDFGMGAVLSQIDENGCERVIAYASRTLSKAERNYSVTRKELLAVITFIAKFRQYLLGRKFVLRTDHNALTWLRNFKHPEGQMARWLEKLEEYTFSILHRPGRKHRNADSMSRIDDSLPINAAAVAANILGDKHIRHYQLQDDIIGPVLVAKNKQKQPNDDEIAKYDIKTRKLFQLWDQLRVKDGVLLRLFLNTDTQHTHHQLVVPKCLQEEILSHLHAGAAGGHLGRFKTLGKLKLRYYWPGHYKDVEQYCSTCHTCATRKTPVPTAKAPLQNITVGYPMQMVGVDLLGPFPRSPTGNIYLVVAVDYFTKWAEAYPVPNMEATTVANVLTNEMFFRFSPPEKLHSDQGRQFESRVIKEVCRILQIKKSRTSPYHPQCDGLVERYNRTILNMLATASKDNPSDWERSVRAVCFAYNTSLQPSTGFSPYYLMYGREARLPVDLQFGTSISDTVSPVPYVKQLQSSLAHAYQLVRNKLGEVQERQKTLYDREVHGKPFEAGDTVWLYSPVIPQEGHRKLHHPWKGPYRVESKLSDLNYKISPLSSGPSPSKPVVVHFNRLKLCTPGTRYLQQSPPSIAAPLTDTTVNVGDLAELCDFSDDECVGERDDSDVADNPPLVTPSPRYPSRARHPPDRLGTYLS